MGDPNKSSSSKSKPKPKPENKRDEAYLNAVTEKRIKLFESIQAQQLAHRRSIGGEPIKITLKDGVVKQGKKWLTSPMDVAREISVGLASSCLIAQVSGVLWVVNRPLEGDCMLVLFKFDSDEGRDTFWHSSAHILGEAPEREYGCKLCIGPCTARGEGFYYDGYYEDLTLNEDHFGQIKSQANKAVAKKQSFERIEVSRAQALEMFAENKFKIKDEVKSVLDFISYAYNIFGFTFELELSTINKGDGAFYGPKIDIGVFDALKRKFQCATLQLDFQLPLRFKLSYSAEEDNKLERPVMIHRAILGSVERMLAILLEHFKGKWPFWLSPRQAMVCPVSDKYNPYALQVRDRIHQAGYYVDVDTSGKTMNKKVREAQVAQYNYTLVVGEQEENTGQVSVRTRNNNEDVKVMSMEDLLAFFKQQTEEYH